MSGTGTGTPMPRSDPAIESANEGDTVLLLGKGDETFMYHEEGRVPWMGDNTAARECLDRILKPEDHHMSSAS